MKTSTVEVLCDGCGAPIPTAYPTGIFVTLRGPAIGHRKVDLHGVTCLRAWATAYVESDAALPGAGPSPHTQEPQK